MSNKIGLDEIYAEYVHLPASPINEPIHRSIRFDLLCTKTNLHCV